MRESIDYLKNEFDELFGHKIYYNAQDKALALEILEHFSKTIQSPYCLDDVTDILKYLERNYKGLFV